MYKVEFYSTKSLFTSRQYRWRIVHRNGNIIAISSEGYNNKADRNEAVYRMIKSLIAGDYKVVDK